MKKIIKLLLSVLLVTLFTVPILANTDVTSSNITTIKQFQNVFAIDFDLSFSQSRKAGDQLEFYFEDTTSDGFLFDKSVSLVFKNSQVVFSGEVVGHIAPSTRNKYVIIFNDKIEKYNTFTLEFTGIIAKLSWVNSYTAAENPVTIGLFISGGVSKQINSFTVNYKTSALPPPKNSINRTRGISAYIGESSVVSFWTKLSQVNTKGTITLSIPEDSGLIFTGVFSRAQGGLPEEKVYEGTKYYRILSTTGDSVFFEGFTHDRKQMVVNYDPTKGNIRDYSHVLINSYLKQVDFSKDPKINYDFNFGTTPFTDKGTVIFPYAQGSVGGDGKIPNNSVEFTVLDDKGKTIENVDIEVFDKDNTLISSLKTDVLGRAFLPGLRYGAYTYKLSNVPANHTIPTTLAYNFSVGIQKTTVPIILNNSIAATPIKPIHQVTQQDIIKEELWVNDPYDVTDNILNLPNATQVIALEKIDNTKAHQGEVRVELVFKNGSKRTVNVPFIVKERISIVTPIHQVTTQDIIREELWVNDLYDVTDNIQNLPNGTQVTALEKIDNTKAHQGEVRVELVFKNGSKRIVNVPFIVREREKEYVTNYVSLLQTLYITKEELWVNDPYDVTDNIQNLPNGTKVTALEKIDNTKAHQGEVRVEIVFIEGSRHIVNVPFIVRDRVIPKPALERLPKTGAK